MPFRDRLQAVLNRRVLPIVLGINLLLLLVFLTFNYLLIFHSDSAVKNLLAQEIWDTHEYFPHDWNYVNNDLWVFYTQTFIIPLLGWFKNGFPLHVFSDLVSASLILLGTWKITGMLGQSRTARLASIILITSGMSLIFAEHVFGQAAYGSMFYMGCFLVYSYWKLTHAQGRAAQGWAAATFILAMLVFWANPQRALIYYGAPLFTAALALHGLDWFHARAQAFKPVQAQPRRMGGMLVLLALGMAAGIGLHSYVMRHVNNVAGLTIINWLPYDGIISNTLKITRGYLNMFDGLPRPETTVVSATGAYSLLRLLASVGALVLLPFSVMKSIQPQQRGRMFFAVFTLVALCGNLLLILTTTLADMNQPEASARYLVPTILCMLILFAGTLFDDRRLKPSTLAIGGFTIIILATSGPWTYLKQFDNFYRFPLRKTWFMDEHVRLGYFLEENKLKYGYSPFWNAGKLTVLTQQRVKVRQIDFFDGLPVPMRFLSSNRWYRPSAWEGETFLLVQDAQFKDLDLKKLFSITGEPSRTLRFEKSWYIYVFPHNLSDMISSWDIEARKPRITRMDASTQHLIGKLEPGTAEEQAALVGEDPEYGPLLFGARPGVAPGTYLVSFDVEAVGQPHDFGVVETTIDAGTRTLAQQAITQPGRQTITLRFDTRHPFDLLEFRVIKHHGGQLKVREVSIRRDLSADKE